MTDVNQLITDHLVIWTSATKKKSNAGRGKSGTFSFYGVKKLRELLLELAVTGRLVGQDPEEGTGHKLKEELKGRREKQNKKNPKRRQAKVSTEKTETFPATLPASWSQVRLSEVSSKIGAGSTPRGGQKSYVEQGICFLRSQNIWNSGLRLDGVAKIPNATHEKMSGTHVFAGDILFNITGASIARTALVQDDFETGNVSQHVAIIRPTSTKIRQFLHVVLMSPFSYKRVMDVQVGVSREGLSIAKLGNFPIPLPPTAEQHRIVAKVDELMELCDALEAQAEDSLKAHQTLVETCLATLTNSQTPEDLTQNWTRLETHFDTLFTTEESINHLEKAIVEMAVKGLLIRCSVNKELAEDWRKRSIIKSNKLVDAKKIRKPKKAIDLAKIEKPFKLPMGWTWTRLPEIGELARGKSKHRPRNDRRLFDGGTYPLIQTGDVSRAKPNITEAETFYNEFGLSQSRIWPKGTLCITIAANIANTGILGIDACFPDSVVGYIPFEDDANVAYFDYFIRTAKNDLEHYAPSTAQKNINLEILGELLVPLPPKAELNQICEKVALLLKICTHLRRVISESKSVQQKLTDTLTSKIH